MVQRLIVSLVLCLLSQSGFADTITIRGSITQSVSDGTGPAVNNPALNSINDGDVYRVILNLSNPITTAGGYTVPGAAFHDPAAPASEIHFGAISLAVTPDGGSFDFSLLACLTTGSGCATGNQLDVNFQIPAGQLNSSGVAASGLDPPHPLDLLEDDGITDIQGTIDTYSYIATPEPSTWFPLGLALALAVKFMRNN